MIVNGKDHNVVCDGPSVDVTVSHPQSQDDHSTSKTLPDTTREVCRLFFRGRCNYGQECKYLHLPRESATEATNVVDSTVSTRNSDSLIKTEKISASQLVTEAALACNSDQNTSSKVHILTFASDFAR